MRRIAILKSCTEQEQAFLRASAGKEDELLFFESEEGLRDKSNRIDVIFGEPSLETVRSKNRSAGSK